MKKRIWILFVIYSISSFSQDAGGNRVTVVETLDAQIIEFKKIKEVAFFTDTSKLNKSQDFSFIRRGISSDYKFRELSAAKVSKEVPKDMFDKRFFGSLGTHTSKNLGFLYDNFKNDYYTYGLSVNYFDNGFKVRNIDASSNNTDLLLYAKFIRKNILFFIDASYNANTHYAYGYQEGDFATEEMSQDLFSNSFTSSKISVSTISNNNDPKLIDYSARFFVSDLNQGRENRLHLSSEIKKHIHVYPFSLQFEFDKYMNHDESNSKTNDVTLAALSPSISIDKYDFNFDLTIGIDYSSEFGVDIFPSLISEKEIVDNILIISAGIESHKYRNTYKLLSDRNPYIHAYNIDQYASYFNDNQDLRTTESRHCFFAVKNRIGKDEYMKAGLQYGFVENLPSFKNNYSTPLNMFLVDYQDLWQLKASLEYEWRISRLFEVNFNSSYYNWGKDTVSHRSNIEFSTDLIINLREKLNINMELNYFGRSYVLNNDDRYHLNQLNSRYHINLDINYDYSKSLSTYLRILNMSNSRKDIWLGYQEMGINAHFGFSYSF